jgi:hypothetical protein
MRDARPELIERYDVDAFACVDTTEAASRLL